MATPRDPRYRRYDRFYTGWGCVSALLVGMLVYWLLTLLITPLAFW